MLVINNPGMKCHLQTDGIGPENRSDVCDFPLYRVLYCVMVLSVSIGC